MNKMHTLTKIILSAIGILFIIRLLSQLPLGIYFFYSRPTRETAGVLLLSLLFTAGIVAVLMYIFIYKRESLAKKIVGSEQLPEPDSQIQWLPVAMRLICIAGGFYFLSIVLRHTTYVLNQLASFKAHTYANHKVINTYAPFSFQDILPWIIMLICSIYLLCGAPHFVRWQVKKTLQQCKEFEDIVTDS